MSSIILNGDTSGSVTVSAPSVAGTQTVTLPAASGSVMVSGNMPAFMAYASTGTTLTTNTNTKITFDTETIDTNNCFASSRFTPTVAGIYQFSVGVRLDTTTGYEWFIMLYKNGVQVRNLHDVQIQQWGISTSAIYDANGTTDYFEVYCFQNSGTNKTTATGQGSVYFAGYLARTL